MSKREPTEQQIEVAICEYLTSKGMFVYKNYDQAKVRDGSYSKDHSFQVSGQSDLMVLVDGTTFHLEVKRPKQAQSPNQILFQSKIEKHGGIYLVAYSSKDAYTKINAVLISSK